MRIPAGAARPHSPPPGERRQAREQTGGVPPALGEVAADEVELELGDADLAAEGVEAEEWGSPRKC
jgi:hypothetical protein